MFMMPELLPAMLSVEALEDNEVLKVEGVRSFSRICDKRQKTKVELLNEPKTVTTYLFLYLYQYVFISVITFQIRCTFNTINYL